MNIKHIVKEYIWTVLGITFLASLLSVIRFIIEINPELIDHPSLLISLTPLDRIFLISYTTFFVFISVTVSFIILLILHKITVSFLKIKIGLREYILLFWALVIIYFVLAIKPRLAGVASRLPGIFWLPNLPLELLLYLSAAVVIIFIYYWMRKSTKTEQLLRSSVCAFIALSLSAYLYNSLDAKFTTPITKENILLAVVILFASGLSGLFCFYFFYKISPHLYRVYNQTSFLKVLITLCIGLSIGISIFAFFWENKKATIDYRQIVSQTKQDVNVILIAIDALRADHLGCYGYARETSPNLDALAKEAVLFKNCYVQSSWTKPSTASLFTSFYPTMHQTILNRVELPDELTTIAEILQDQGFITYSYVANANLKAIFNFDQGFDFFDDYLMRDKLRYICLRNTIPFNIVIKKITGKGFEAHGPERDNIKLVNKRVIPWLKKYKDENFFMYIHYMDPHAPYWPPRPYRNMFPCDKKDNNSKDISLYDGEIRFADEYIGKLFDRLKAWGIYDKTLIIITADHGEAFGEHGDRAHGHTIYQHQLKVPLIIKYAKSLPQGKIIEPQVRNIDIMPTILDILNISYTGHLEGMSLLPLCRGKDDQGQRENIYVEENLRNQFILKGIIRDNTWKYIFTEKSEWRDVKRLGHEELYNLADDPRELNNLLGQESEVLKFMRAKLDFYKRYCEERAVSPAQKELDYETFEQLKSLGYLQ